MNNDIEQQLNNYTDKYQKHEKWLKKETDHYVFHYLKNSQAEEDIKYITQRQEDAFNKITDTLGLEMPKSKIKYYFYPDEQLKTELMGDDGNAQAIWHDFSIHVVYTGKIKPIGEHEDTHLLVLPWGISIGFLQEGLAEYMGGCNWHGKDADEITREAFSEKKMLKINSVMTNEDWLNVPDENIVYYYNVASSFVRFLFEKYGKEKFKKLYKQTPRTNTKEENIKAFENIYKISLAEVEKDFIHFMGIS